MNRGIEGLDIFFDNKSKVYFIECLKELSRKLKIRIFAYCLMDNHYHLILQNSSGKLSDFMRQLNGKYGIYYRKRKGGKGYVFQSRFKSTLIENNDYLLMSILYVLLNPVRANITMDPYEYRWSSIDFYFSNTRTSFIDNEFIEELIGRKHELNRLLDEWTNKKLPIKTTRIGDVIGSDEYMLESLKKFDRREKKDMSLRMRIDETPFKDLKQIIVEFEAKRGIKIDDLNLDTFYGKRVRGELLVFLKDSGGLTYKQIMEIPIFKSLKYSSLGHLYKRAKERKVNNVKN